jgi:hypothetical protein
MQSPHCSRPQCEPPLYLEELRWRAKSFLKVGELNICDRGNQPAAKREPHVLADIAPFLINLQIDSKGNMDRDGSIRETRPRKRGGRPTVVPPASFPSSTTAFFSKPPPSALVSLELHLPYSSCRGNHKSDSRWRIETRPKGLGMPA